MDIDQLSSETQEGLRLWAKWQHDDDMLFDDMASIPEIWAWIWFQLRAAEDRPEWFPRGKWAVLQLIETYLDEEARIDINVRTVKEA